MALTAALISSVLALGAAAPAQAAGADLTVTHSVADVSTTSSTVELPVTWNVSLPDGATEWTVSAWTTDASGTWPAGTWSPESRQPASVTTATTQHRLGVLEGVTNLRIRATIKSIDTTEPYTGNRTFVVDQPFTVTRTSPPPPPPPAPPVYPSPPAPHPAPAHANNRVDPADDPDDTHEWVTTRGEWKQIRNGMHRDQVERILDGHGAPYEGSPYTRYYGDKHNGAWRTSAVISYDKRWRVDYAAWTTSEWITSRGVSVGLHYADGKYQKRKEMYVGNSTRRRVSVTVRAKERSWNFTLKPWGTQTVSRRIDNLFIEDLRATVRS
ncbi:hypothetical protein [Nocardioides sp. P5_E3]